MAIFNSFLYVSIKNGNVSLIYPLRIVIFHGYVSLPEGIPHKKNHTEATPQETKMFTKVVEDAESLDILVKYTEAPTGTYSLVNQQFAIRNGHL